MSDPVKIIWKYKNNNRRVQYNTYIFIGNLIPKNIKTILEKIKEYNLYDTLINLSKEEYKIMEKFYGNEWYNKFFNIYHINSTFFLIKETSAQREEIIKLYGQDWFENNINKKQLIEKKIIYSYEALIRNDLERKNQKKGRNVVIGEDDGETNFSLSKKIDLNKLFSKKIARDVPITDSTNSSSDSASDTETQNQYGGYDKINHHFHFKFGEVNDSTQLGGADEEAYEETDEEIDDLTDEETDDLTNETDEQDDKAEEESESEDEEQNLTDANELDEEEELDYDEIEKIYKEDDVNPDDKIKETTSLIKKALNDDKIFEKKNKNMIEFDKSKDTNMYDENLRDIYVKYYIYNQYIYNDDNIKTIKEKICTSIKCNDKFDSDLYLAPSRQYLWADYYYDNNINKIMIGQKWLRRNELLNIDVEPNNNIRVYEELRGLLKTLKDSIKRYNNKIRMEDDSSDILIDYSEYIVNNEIYMIDIYNELGLNYNPEPEILRNIQDIYIKIYFPKIRNEDVKSIIDFLNQNKKNELNKTNLIFETINNDLILENEIMNTVETVKMNDKFDHIFKENYVTQSVIHLNLRMDIKKKLNLYRIFNEFEVSDTYPFIQYQTPDGQIIYKFNENEINEYTKHNDSKNILLKWFENAPYGISFKVKIHEKNGIKFRGIQLSENGRIEYKTQWKAEDMATIQDIKNTHEDVKKLIEKINKENNKTTFIIPEDSEFKFAFINTIQQFELPKGYIINHNDLSKFSKYFFPYISLVIEPRKRQAKIKKENEKSKYGTYLRYKRVSKYENQTRIEQRIMYFIRNFEFTEKLLANEIGKQFNITEERALEEYQRVKEKYPNLKKSRKVLKKFENIPKYKPPGIGIDIQGKAEDRYKIRISGARDKTQLDRIIIFLNILLFLYIETYHMKKPERQALIKKLEQLKNIADRRGKVEEIVKYYKESNNIKEMGKLDKKRLAYKPEEGQNQYSRNCQNSGKDKRRRPQQYTNDTMDQLLKKGYYLNKKTGEYEKKTMIKGKNGKKTEIKLKTIKLDDYDDEGNLTGNEIHYACDPEDNGEHFYVGFLTKSINPHGQCMPCCFIKDPSISNNKDKQEKLSKCLGKPTKKTDIDEQKAVGDRLYILQDTNKIQEGRFGLLPKYLDIYFNFGTDRTQKIKHHYLLKTETGYFFKYGSKQDEQQFLNAISSILDIQLNTIINKITTFLENDKSEQIFTSLNGGDIKTQFETKEKYIDYIKNAENLEFNMINHILIIPGVISKTGLNIIVFAKKTIVIKKDLEKEKVREDFLIQCTNNEDITNLKTSEKNTIIIMKENKNYYPIVLVTKIDEQSKSVDLTKIFKYENKKNNILNHLDDFYSKNCGSTFTNTIAYKNSSLNAHMLYDLLNNLDNKDYGVKYQYIDTRNKCKYLIINNDMLLPVRPSGSMYNVRIIKNIDKYISDYSKTFELLQKIYKSSKKQIPVKPIGVYYDESENPDKYTLKINAIMTKTHDIVPIIPTNIKISELEEKKLAYENKPVFDKIDNEILKGRKNYIVDDRIMRVNKNKYNDESYQLFRLELSTYINNSQNLDIKAKIEKIITNHGLSKKEKINKLKLIIYRITNKELYNQYKKISESYSKNEKYDDTDDAETDDIEDIQTGGKHERLIFVDNKLPDLTEYKINNDREICNINENKDTCNTNPHCKWSGLTNKCYMSLTEEMTIEFVNRISEELSLNELKAIEILQVEGYFVSDIVDPTRFTEKQGQVILRSTSNTIKKTLDETFGKDIVPVKIGRRKMSKSVDINYQQLNSDNPLKDMKQYFVQKVLDINLPLYRAYVNGYYWIQNKLSDIQNKNLGYYSSLQTNLAIYFKSHIIDWLSNSKNQKSILSDISDYIPSTKKSKNIINDFIIKLSKETNLISDCVVELYILSQINRISIVIYDQDDDIVYIFDKGLIYDKHKDKEIPKSHIKLTKEERFDCINLRFYYITDKYVPNYIEVLYFKQ